MVGESHVKDDFFAKMGMMKWKNHWRNHSKQKISKFKGWSTSVKIFFSQPQVILLKLNLKYFL